MKDVIKMCIRDSNSAVNISLNLILYSVDFDFLEIRCFYLCNCSEGVYTSCNYNTLSIVIESEFTSINSGIYFLIAIDVYKRQELTTCCSTTVLSFT